MRHVSDPYAKAKFSVELDKDDLGEVQKIVINFFSLAEKNGKTWARVLSLKEREGPAEGQYVPSVVVEGLDIGKIRDLAVEAFKRAGNGLKNDPSVFGGMLF